MIEILFFAYLSINTIKMSVIKALRLTLFSLSCIKEAEHFQSNLIYTSIHTLYIVSHKARKNALLIPRHPPNHPLIICTSIFVRLRNMDLLLYMHNTRFIICKKKALWLPEQF